MSLSLAELIAEERARGFARLSGSRIHARVPLRDGLIARLLDLLPLPSTIRGPQVRFLDGNRVYAGGGVRVFGFTKRIEVMLRVAPAIDPGPPRRLEIGFVGRSLLSTAIAVLGPLLGKLPPGVRIENDIVTLDLDSLGAAAGVGDLVAGLCGMSFDGRDGVMWIDVEAQIDPAETARAASDRVASAHSPGRMGAEVPEVPLAELIGLLRGLRARVRLRVEESLVNDAAAAALGGLRESGPRGGTPSGAAPPDWSLLLAAIGTPHLGFEPGAVRVDVDVTLDDRDEERAPVVESLGGARVSAPPSERA